MVDAATVRQLALSLPESTQGDTPDTLDFDVRGKGFAWTYRERIAPKQPRRLRPDVLAVRCLMERKRFLLEAAPEIFFEDDHYRGYPGVLVRLDLIEVAELASLLEAGWRIQAPRVLVKAYDAARGT